MEVGMNSRLKGGLVAAAAVAALAGGGAAIAGATGGGGNDTAIAPATGGDDQATGHDDGPGQPITGSALDKAKSVALRETGGGQVTGSEIRDEEGYYEVEVTRADGSQVDVHMDRNYNILDSQSDGSGADEGGASN
jgi:uncharacterized membrane protein YkoI